MKHSLDATYKVVTAYRSTCSEPILLRRGDRVHMGREYCKDPEWPGWIWCRARNGRSGWVPKIVLTGDGARGRALEDYNAHELSVQPGEDVWVLRILNGWAWARRDCGETGWVPLRNLAPEGPRQPG